ncbi:MAG: alkaline phosphatase D family protein [Verrucomicrobia bacterium]|nr:alkaline phosphatase D family protein [Verrucomicrobiota bacterium]
MLPPFRATCLAALFASAPLFGQVAAPLVSGPWCGNVTATSATVAVRLNASGLAVRLALARTADLGAPSYFGPITTQAATGNLAKLDVAGLLPATTYYYAFEVGGALRTEPAARGSFRTFPLGAASFKLAFASCGDLHAANQTAYDAVLAEQPVLFIHMGDFEYSDTNSTNVADYRGNYDAVLNQPNEAALYRGVALAYMWDDHDFCGNGSDSTSVGRDAARQAYNESAPHYPIALAAGGTLSQSFTIGRVRVIMTDLRSGADPRGQADTAAKSHLGAAQKAWFKQELISARDAGFPLILWVSTIPWIGAAGSGDDDWSVYATERRELANFIRDNGIRNLVLLSGDMHALAYDDGTHSDYAEGGGAPLVVLQAAALTSAGSIKGGPYSGGPVPGSQQYGVLEIIDNGGPSVQCRFTGKRVGEGAKLTFAFSATSGANPGYVAPAPSALINISARGRIASATDNNIVGFVISGSVPRTILIRAVGPSLAPYGVTDALPDPTFKLYQGQTVLAANDNWGDAAATLASTFTHVGAFAYGGIASKDAAAVVTLLPGVYSVVATSADGGTGTVLVEVYDVR